jgi:hypothetical protein
MQAWGCFESMRFARLPGFLSEFLRFLMSTFRLLSKFPRFFMSANT